MQVVYYPLTNAQKRIWYTEQFYPGTSLSNLGGFAKLKSETAMNCNMLMEAIQQVVRLNDSLRLRLVPDDGGEPSQYVADYKKFDIELFDFTNAGDDRAITEWGHAEARKLIPIYDSDLFYFAIFKINSKETWLFAKVHHVIADGISMVLLTNQIIDMYLKLEKGQQEPHFKQPSYAEHIQSELEYERSERFKKDKSFWNEQYESIPEFTVLKRKESYLKRMEAVRFSKVISDSLQSEIQVFCKQNNISVLSLFLSLVDIYTYRTTGQQDVVVGTFMANRTNAKEKQMLGMFVSTIPIRTHIDENTEFLTFVSRKMKDQLSIIRHQKYPYNVLVNDLREKHGSINRLFGMSLEFQVMQWQQQENISYLIEPLFSGYELNDISIHVKERWDNGTLAIDIDYRADLFSNTEINTIFQCIMTLLEDALAHPDKKLFELEICAEDEKQRLLQQFIRPGMPYTQSMTLPDLFEQQVEKNPEHAAIVYEGKTITFKELNERANHLGRILRKKGITSDTPVAILMERSESTIIAIMGVLKAGGAYVPIDPDLPEERIRFIVQDTRAKVLITEQHLFRRYDLETTEALVLDDTLLNKEESGNLPLNAGPHHLAYIIYTSGTTGKPKGVMIEHRQVHHLIEGLRKQVYSKYEDMHLHVALIAPFHFDASVQQIFASLLLGHTLYIVPKSSISDGQTLANYYRSNRIDVTDGTPAHLQMLLSAGNLQGMAVRQMLIGGEALPHSTVRELLELFPDTSSAPTITNVYGPTECCVDASAFELLPTQSDAEICTDYVPIGKALGNHRLYILDSHGRLQPEGAVGELHIAGDGVGRGYLNLPELTADKFAADPHVPGERMYKTGDLARCLPSGDIEFLGRIDDQVKIRGYRIELGEIEAVLQKHTRIKKSKVLTRPDGQWGLELCAYIVLKNTNVPISDAELKQHLSKELPFYMLPSYFVQLEQMPLTSSGKVDRNALLQQEVITIRGRDYEPPAGELEARLVTIWQDVLRMEQVGMYDHFFELGGHSLKAMTLLSRVHKEFGVEVPLQSLFEMPNVRAMAQYISDAERRAFVSIEPAQVQAAYPLSFAQQRVYIVSQLEDAGIGYNMPAAVVIEGRLDIQRLQQAFRELIQRHEVLRTWFVTTDGVPMQKIQDQAPFEIAVESELSCFIRPFDLSQAPLLRVGLKKLDEDKHMLLFDMHHLISDGVSIGILLNDLARLYGGKLLPELRLQYKDYAVWQSRQPPSVYAKEEEYWLTTLSGELPVLQLLTDHPRPPVQSFNGNRVTIVLDKELKNKLNQLAQTNGATLYMVMLAAYCGLLAKYTGQEDILVGTPAAGRNHADLEGIVGMFVNTLAIRMRIDRQNSFTDYLQEVRHNVVSAFDHQNYPFERLAEKLNLPRDLSRNPLFDTMFILQNAFEDIPEIGDMRLSIHETNFGIAKFDLTLQAKEERDCITVDLDYSTALFSRETIERMLTHYLKLLESITADPAVKLGDCSILTEEEQQRLLLELNPPATDYPKHRTIVQLFQEQTGQTPDRTALVFEGKTLTYKQLNERANQLARTLLSRGVQSGTVVAILVNRSIEMAVGILAILKAGGAYVPIDPEHPVQRINYYLADCEASVLLTQRSLQPIMDEFDFDVDCLFVDDADLFRGDAANLDIEIHPDHLANLTYTSGTTGNPKGNMVTHANIIRTVKCTNYMEITNEDVFLVLSNYVFDAFMFDLFGALLSGAKLVLIPKDIVLDISRLPQVIEQERITVLMITTALFNLLVDVCPSSLAGLRKVLFGGERASVEHVRQALQVVGKGKLLHMYGPSESTVFATYYEVDEVAEDAVMIPIGKPISNTAVYILDAFNQLQPVGAAGELCVAGDGLVLGYYNRPELTAEKFVSHPFQANRRIYRTGDLARWLPDGSIEFIGRIDHQVKIRGQRIELGEIEHQLLSHESIRETVVLAEDTGSGEKLLFAYIVTDVPLSNSELRVYAAKKLPAYMIPAAFIQLDQIPLTGNGKVDRRALPKPNLSAGLAAEYASPQTETEVQLANIWQDLLGIEQIGVHDSFFELGGHSLKAMTMLARIHQSMHVVVPLRVLFQSPTIAALAQTISAAGENPFDAISQAEVREVYPVSSAQKRMYVLQQLEGAQHSYNIPAVLRIEGSLELERFEAVMKELVMRHEILRTSFEALDGEPVQRILEQVDFAVSYREAAQEEVDQIIGEFIRPFALHEAPLVRLELVRLDKENHLLLFDIHHIISDGASVSVLIDEITRLYAGEMLQPLRIQYKDYAAWQQSFQETDGYRQQEAYWLAQFADPHPMLNLPTDYMRPAVQSFAGDRINFTIEPKLTQELYRLAQESGTTLYMVLLASYSTFLAKLSGQDDIVVGSPIAGRPHADLSNMIGMFVNTMAMRTHPTGEKAFAAFLQEVKQVALGAYECQDYPFEELVQQVQVQRDMSRNPLFDTLFVLQNTDQWLLKMEDARIEPYAFDYKIAKFDLSLSSTEAKDTIVCSMEYSTSLFKRETIERWIGYFIEMLHHIVAEPTVTLADVNLLTEEEKQLLLVEFNDTKRKYPREKTIHELFEDQAERMPDNEAVVWNNQVITYRELNEKANRLAKTLRVKGLQPDSVAGIMLESSINIVVGILAILKAGGAYLPIDPDYPDDRVHYLIKDSGAALVLTEWQFADRLPGIDLLLMDNPEQEMADSTNLAHINRPEDLAYVIYTSGSTGQPKGVMVEHRNVVRLVHNAGYIPFDETCRMAQTGAISFDASTFELFGALLHGGTLYPVPKSILLDVARFTQFLQEYRITTMWLTSPLFNQLAQGNAGMFDTVQHLIVGGDALVPQHVNQVRRACPELSLWNGYGPTENTTFSTCFLIDQDYGEPIPIGMPIGNSSAFIVDSNYHLQPIGVPGELCVGGDGVARGYLHRPDLTKEKFVDNPFIPGERMYRTGDLARLLPDGNIEYLGRMDQQVKVRGFRIELGEIESQLMQVDGVNEAVVITRHDESGQTSLCAYLIGERELTTAELRSALSRSLPGYMLPSYFVQIEKMPLTPNGKVDRRALPEPDVEAGREEYIEPRNEREELLCVVWQDVLGVKQVGIGDNFFSLGGDSIKSIQMAARLHKYGWKLEMKDLFQHPTIEQFSVYLQSMNGSQADQAPVEGNVALTPIQHWFFGRRFTDMHHWNQAVMMYAPVGLKPQIVEQTLRKIVEHHDALRMTYTFENGRVVQYNHGLAKALPELEVIRPDVPRSQLEQAILLETERIQSSIDLSSGPLLKAALFQTAQGDQLLIVIHHLVVDGVSWRILMEDFAEGYRQVEKGDVIVFPTKTHSYREWAARLQEYANSKTCLKEIDYWNRLNVAAVSLPKDNQTSDRRMRRTHTVEFLLTVTETHQLTTRVHDAYRTEMNDILLTALGLTIQQWTEQKQVVVNLEGHGREEIIGDIDVSRTVGWFTTQYPIVLDMQHSADLAYQIKRVKEDLRHIPNKGIGFGLLRYLTAYEHKSDLILPPVPEISFNYLGQFAETAGAGLFKRSPLSTGNSLSPATEQMHPIDIVGVIEGDVLRITIAYNALEYEQETMLHLSERFKVQLLQLIKHCLEQTNSELTPSDLGDDELTFEELDMLLEIL